MSHYDKLPPHREAAVDDAPAEAKAVPSWESARLRAHETVTRRTLWIGPAKAAVLHALIDNVRPDTRIAIVKQRELARQCGIRRTYLQELLRGLHLDPPHFIKRNKGQRASTYHISGELFDAPQPEPTIHGPLLDGPPVQIRRVADDIESAVTIPDAHPSMYLNRDARSGEHLNSNPDAHPGVHLNSLMLAPASIRSPAHKGTRPRVGRLVGSNSQTTDHPTNPSADFGPAIADLNVKELLRALVQHDEKATMQDAILLAVNWRAAMPEVTQDTIVHFAHVKGDDIKAGNNAHHAARVIATKSAEQYAGTRAQMYQDQQQRKRLESEASNRQVEEEQRRTEGDADTSAANAAYLERERQAAVKKVCDDLRAKAQFLAKQDHTRSFAEDVNQLAQRVESGVVFALKESLFAIKEKIDIALLNATSQNDIDQLRQRAEKLGRQLNEGLWIWHLGYNFRIELSPETLRSWRRSTERAC